ncbi:MAG: cache domain-containing protein [Campylobacterota bacterium]|nr:cache domain-containing protein [Campylobacterota bacterium]
MNRENLFLKIITFAPLVFIPLIIGLVSFAFIHMYNTDFQNNLEKTTENLFNIEKSAVEIKIQNTSDVINYRKSILQDRLKIRVKQRVEKAYAIAQSIYEEHKDTQTQTEIKSRIRTAIKPLLWNAGESFIWIVDYEGVFQLAPEYLKNLEGSSIINFQDAMGRYVIQEEIAMCKSRGEGFLWDTFTKPNENSDRQYRQVAFVKAFGHYSWYFGSAEYLDTANKKTDKTLLSTLKYINTVNNSYTFVLSTKGKILMNASIPEYEGKNLSDIKDKNTTSVINNIISKLRDKDSAQLAYEWLNPSTNKVEIKYTYIQKVPNSDWIIGSGFYVSDINSKILKQKLDLNGFLSLKSNNVLYIALIVMFISLLASYYLTKKLKENFAIYKKNINTQKNELLQLNDTLESKVEHRTSELEKLKNDFEKLATIDTLTQIDNRYSLMEQFAMEINRSKRYDTSLSIIMLDIDFFKQVNDIYGHAVGDCVLTALASLIKRNLRESDIVGRYGGEEFIIILPGTDLEDAKQFAHRLREDVQEHSFDTIKQITISLGLVELRREESIDDVFKRVDDLLYKSKTDGRNRVSH